MSVVAAVTLAMTARIVTCNYSCDYSVMILLVSVIILVVSRTVLVCDCDCCEYN